MEQKQYKITFHYPFESKVVYLTAYSILSADKIARTKYASLIRYASSMDVEEVQ